RPGNKLEFRRSRGRRRGDDDDAKTVQSEVQGAGGGRGDPRGKDAEPVGIAVQGASDADRQVAEGGAGATAGTVRRWAVAKSAERGRRQGRALRGDRSAEDGTGLAQKKSWSARLRTGAPWWSWRIPISASGASVSCWA